MARDYSKLIFRAVCPERVLKFILKSDETKGGMTTVTVYSPVGFLFVCFVFVVIPFNRILLLC